MIARSSLQIFLLQQASASREYYFAQMPWTDLRKCWMRVMRESCLPSILLGIDSRYYYGQKSGGRSDLNDLYTIWKIVQLLVNNTKINLYSLKNDGS